MKLAAEWIRVIDDAFSPELCDALIAEPDEGHLIDHEWRRCQQRPVSPENLARVKGALRPHVAAYRELCRTLNFVTLLEAPNVYSYEPATEKPHHFHEHADAWNVESATRQISVIVYLNDVDGGGGETAFTMLGSEGTTKPVWPKRGRLLLFPANFIFSHLARAPKRSTKHVLVTWLHFGGEGVRYLASPLES